MTVLQTDAKYERATKWLYPFILIKMIRFNEESVAVLSSLLFQLEFELFICFIYTFKMMPHISVNVLRMSSWLHFE